MPKFRFLHLFITSLLLHSTFAKMFPIDKKMSKTEISKIQKPAKDKSYFSFFSLKKYNVEKVEIDSYDMKKCLPDEATLTKFSKPNYKWTGPNSESKLVDFEKIKAFKDGSVELIRLQKEDSGTYYCHISSDTDSETKIKYEHTYAVFLNPDYSLERAYHFTSEDCNEDKIKKVISLAETRFCGNEAKCSFEFRKDSCAWDSDFKAYRLRIVIVQLSKTMKYAGNCGIECRKEKTEEKLEADSEKQENSFEKVLNLDYSEGKEMVYQEEKSEEYFTWMCPPGYEPYNEFACVPCDVGTYSQQGYEKCVQCGAMSYQDLIAKTSCVNCSLLKLTAKFGSANSSDCVYFVASYTFMLVALPSFFVVMVIAIWCFNFSWMVIFPMMGWLCKCCKKAPAKMVSDPTNMQPQGSSPYTTKKQAVGNVVGGVISANKTLNVSSTLLSEKKKLRKKKKRGTK